MTCKHSASRSTRPRGTTARCLSSAPCSGVRSKSACSVTMIPSPRSRPRSAMPRSGTTTPRSTPTARRRSWCPRPSGPCTPVGCRSWGWRPSGRSTAAAWRASTSSSRVSGSSSTRSTRSPASRRRADTRGCGKPRASTTSRSSTASSTSRWNATARKSGKRGVRPAVGPSRAAPAGSAAGPSGAMTEGETHAGTGVEPSGSRPAKPPPRQSPAVLIAGGGTGGHTSPGLAVAVALSTRGVPCAWIGSAAGVEARLVPERGIPYHAIPTGKLRRYWAWRNLVDLGVNVPAGVVAAWRLVGRLRPRVVFATGGFVAVPVAVAAAARGVPLVVHEQTAVPGLANRLTARLAQRVAVTFPDESKAFAPAKVVVTGNPLRPELRAGSRLEAAARFGLDPALPLVYVTGGAQGAHRINRAVGEILEPLLAQAHVIHQCGDQPKTGDHGWLEARRAALPPVVARRYAVVSYVGGELASIYAAAALVLGRAGAGTVNECCHLGLPALYVPLPGTSGEEQVANARQVERVGGCAVLAQADLTPSRLLERLQALLAEPAALKDMGERARSLAVPDAADRLARLLLDVADA